jgi:biotin carboxyl carrier protein
MSAIRRDEVVFEGEAPPIPERLLTSPTRGRLHHHRVRDGRHLRPGTVIGEVKTSGGRVQVRSWMQATFLGWLVGEGEVVEAGRPIAIVLPSDAREGTSVIRRP